MPKLPKQDKNGYLHGRLRSQRAGVIVRENGKRLLLPEEVVKKAAEAYTHVPLKQEHAGSNIGTIFNTSYEDGYVKANYVLWEDPDHQEISAGYRIVPDMTPGVWIDENGLMGEPGTSYQFDYKAIDLIPNHVATTKKGRAGNKVALNLDSECEEETLVFELDIVSDGEAAISRNDRVTVMPNLDKKDELVQDSAGLDKNLFTTLLSEIKNLSVAVSELKKPEPILQDSATPVVVNAKNSKPEISSSIDLARKFKIYSLAEKHGMVLEDSHFSKPEDEVLQGIIQKLKLDVPVGLDPLTVLSLHKVEEKTKPKGEVYFDSEIEDTFAEKKDKLSAIEKETHVLKFNFPAKKKKAYERGV
ncbi:MAG: DUF2213 domain-containing protein [Xenococcaceae cyanobacterium]